MTLHEDELFSHLQCFMKMHCVFQQFSASLLPGIHWRYPFSPSGLTNLDSKNQLPEPKDYALFILEPKAMAPHSSTLAWKIPWMEEPCRLQSVGSQGVGHD